MQTANIHKWEIWKFIEVLRLHKCKWDANKSTNSDSLLSRFEWIKRKLYVMGDMWYENEVVFCFSLKIFEICWISLVQIASGEFTGWINNATLHITHWTRARGRAQIQKKPMNKLKYFLFFFCAVNKIPKFYEWSEYVVFSYRTTWMYVDLIWQWINILCCLPGSFQCNQSWMWKTKQNDP